MFDQLELILKELVTEFNQKKIALINNPRTYYAMRQGEYAVQGTTRYSTTHHRRSSTCFDYGIMLQVVGDFIAQFESTKKLYEFINEKGLWHERYESIEASQKLMPSMMTKIAGGFLCRNFSLNDHNLDVSNESFTKSFRELVNFFQKDTVEYDVYIHLRGCKGEIDYIELTDHVSVVKADFDMAKYFSILYHINNFHGPIMFEGDYLLKITFTVPKTNYDIKYLSKHNLNEWQTIKKWNIAPLLSTIGYVSLGKQIRVSSDWPLAYGNVMGPFGVEDTIPIDRFSFINDETTLGLKALSALINEIPDINSADIHIKNAIDRLTRSKSSKNINDRAVELAIAFEHLIDSEPHEVTYQLCVKSIKLFNEKNADEQIYKKLKDFYALRSNVVHGNSKNKKKTDNQSKEELIDYAEGIVQRMIIKMLKFNKTYTYEEINVAISKSIYINKTIDDLLEQGHQNHQK